MATGKLPVSFLTNTILIKICTEVIMIYDIIMKSKPSKSIENL